MSHWRQQMGDGAEHLISYHWLAFLSAFIYLQLIQNSVPSTILLVSMWRPNYNVIYSYSLLVWILAIRQKLPNWSVFIVTICQWNLLEEKYHSFIDYTVDSWKWQVLDQKIQASWKFSIWIELHQYQFRAGRKWCAVWGPYYLFLPVGRSGLQNLGNSRKC